MTEDLAYAILADVVLALHVGIVLFVIGGLVLIIAGNLLRWRWVNSLWFRLIHLATIAVVVAESWFNVACPLTTWEMRLRTAAGAAFYEGDFIAHWLGRLLYYEAPPWVFIACYTIFGVIVAATWWIFPPRLRRSAHAGQTDR